MSADGFRHLGRAARIAARVAVSPRASVHLLLAGGVALSWALLAAMAVRGAALRLPDAAAPGDALLGDLPALTLPEFLDRFFALCLSPAPLAGSWPQSLAALTLMWFLMATAMMLPSAAPMVRTYCEIADTARQKGERVVHPLVLVAGYLGVWMAASLAFAGATLFLSSLASAPGEPLRDGAAAVALALAGLYQFSGLKEACLEKCRHPFAVLFARWSTRPASIFRLGAEQGVWCLGCCWALMLVMFAVGIMNLFWMALIGLFTIVEKQVSGPLPTRAAGAILLVWAAALLLGSP